MTTNLLRTNADAFLPVKFGESAWYQHVPFAYWLIEQMKPKSFMELGVHNGVSYFAFCEAARQLNLNSKFIAVDNWVGDTQAGLFDTSVFNNLVLNHKKYENFSTFMKSNFKEALSKIEDNSIELIHIDGFHSYNQVKNDYNFAFEKVNKENGIILLHDVNEYQITFGVNEFFSELEIKFRTFKFNHGHGLGVVLIGSNIDPNLIEMLVTDNTELKNGFRKYFEVLGQRCELYASNIQLKEIMIEQKNLLHQNTKKIEDLLKNNDAIKIESEKQIYQLTNSISWRLTQPLRYLKRILK